ncbi:MAG TPA: hypothetical protein GXX18_05940 [Bacillales bacterium]|nr:hypothetical protein [Bacillales bacterium]
MEENNSIKVEFNNELIKNMKIEGILTSPYDEVSVAILSDQEIDAFIVKIFYMHKEKQVYKISHELITLKMESRYKIDKFIQHLPHMSAIELLIMLNSNDSSRQQREPSTGENRLLLNIFDDILEGKEISWEDAKRFLPTAKKLEQSYGEKLMSKIKIKQNKK